MTRQEITSLLNRRLAAQNRHDIPGLTALYADDCIVDSPTAGGAVRGHAGVESVHRAWLTAFPDVVFTASDLLIDDDRVVQVVDATGTDTGGFMGLSPTRRAFRVPIVFICTVKDDRISHERRIYDFTGMLIQLGVLKAKPAQ